MNFLAIFLYCIALLFLIISLFMQQVAINLDDPIETYVARVKYTLMSVFFYYIVANEGDLALRPNDKLYHKAKFMKRVMSVLCGMHVIAIGTDAYVSKYYYWLVGVILIVLLYYLIVM